MDGFLLVDKPKGMTSFKVCNTIRKQFNLNKVGHNGTLDPNATGLMILATDKATKLLKLINEHDKAYIATITFGYNSKTLDFDSDIIEDINMNFSKEELLDKINELKLSKTQIPPMTSAIKVDGKKLYEYQRENKEVNLKPRDIKIYESSLLDFKIINNHIEIDIYLSVSKGFYVRSYARDLGKLLGGIAILKDLRRVKIDNYSIEDSKDLDKINEDDFISIFDFFKFPIIDVRDYLVPMIKNGVELDSRQTTIDGIFYVRNNCDIIAIYEKVEENKYKPILIF